VEIYVLDETLKKITNGLMTDFTATTVVGLYYYGIVSADGIMAAAEDLSFCWYLKNK
jgi:hypothetical protein